MNAEQILKNIRERKCIAIVRGVDVADCVPLSRALYDGGINMVEVTFDQTAKDGYKNTLDGIRAISDTMQGKIYVGAGTVMNVEQLMLAKEANAEYIISPHTNQELIRRTVQSGLIAIPGALTPSEAVIAYEAGASFVKLFPAGIMGTGYIKSIMAPLKYIPFLAVGDIDDKNVAEFMKAGVCGVGIGGKLINKEWIKNKEFGKITELAKKYVSNINS